MKNTITLLYDKECPFCNNYALRLSLQKHYELKLLNARENPVTVKTLREKGYDINNGMIVLENQTTIYQGAKAVAFLNKCSQKQNVLLQTWWFKKILYPCIKGVRLLVLKWQNKTTEI